MTIKVELFWRISKDLVILTVLTLVFLFPPNYLGLAVIGGAFIVSRLSRYQEITTLEENTLKIKLRR